MNIFVNEVNKDNITHLSLGNIDGYCDKEYLDNPRFGNLQYLKLVGELAGVWFTYNSDNTGIHLPKLYHLVLNYIVYMVMLLYP